jgi:hypothetical protein
MLPGHENLVGLVEVEVIEQSKTVVQGGVDRGSIGHGSIGSSSGQAEATHNECQAYG